MEGSHPCTEIQIDTEHKQINQNEGKGKNRMSSVAWTVFSP